MTTCDYCGKPNSEDFQTCQYCGTDLSELLNPAALVSSPTPPFDIPPIIQEFTPPILPPPKPILNARRATRILLVFVGVQIVIGIAAAAFTGSFANPAEMNLATLGLVVLLSLLASGLVFWRMALDLGPPTLQDSTPRGACWVPGSMRHILLGLALGTLLGSGYISIALMLPSDDSEQPAGILTTMAMTPGLPQLYWFIAALLLAPPIEELLFRGVLFGGYAQSFGRAGATLLTTFIFTLMHVGEAIYFPPAFLAIASLALLATWLRLHSAAIGPAIALHFAYNATVGLTNLALTQ